MGASSGVIVVVAVLVVATAVGALLKRRNGNFRAAAVPAGPVGGPISAETSPGPNSGMDAGTGVAADPVDATLTALGVTADTPVTLVQFSSAFCAPCRTTRVLCADVAAKVPGVRHVEVDAESHLEAVRALEIWRTPTVLIVDGQGRIRSRASGAPTRAQLVAALADFLPRTDLGTAAARG